MSFRNVWTLAIVTIFIPRLAAADVATELQDRFIAVAEQASDSVVFILVESTWAGQGDPERDEDPFFDYDPGGFEPLIEGSGSGVILDEQGHILTNYHVVRGSVEISVRTHDGRVHPATVVGEDPATDLAVIRIEAGGLRPARFATGGDIAIGQWAIALGAPFGLTYSMTVGHISATGRQGLGDLPIQDFLQTDASINPGNSGGPLVDIEGRVIGINTMILGLGTGIGLAISCDLATAVAAALIADGRVVRGQSQMRLQDADEALRTLLGAPAGTPGVVVAMVEDGGAAAAAGLQPGDVITRVGGAPAEIARDIERQLYDLGPGAEVEVERYREGKAQTVALVLAETPPMQLATRERVEHTGDDLGFNVDILPEQLAAFLAERGVPPGLMVKGVRPGSPAQRAGFHWGDVILSVDGVDVRYPIDIAKQTLESKRDHLLMYVFFWPDESYRYVALEKP